MVALRRMEESLARSLRALELDPLDAEMGVHLAWHYYSARQYDKAIETCERTIEIDPNFHETYWFLGLAYEGKDMFADAITALVPVVVPFIVYLVKQAIGSIPKAVLPLLAVGAGLGLTYVQAFIAGGEWNVIVGAALGGLGVFVREVVNTIQNHGLEA